MQVVDQAGGAEEGGDQNHQVAVLRGGRAQVQGVTDFQVIDPKTGAFDQLGLFGEQLCIITFALLDGRSDLASVRR